MRAVRAAPLCAVDVSIGTVAACPAPGLALDGLRVDGETDRVLGDGNERAEGLYAVGRSAAGICSNGYVSGLSFAECAFSGRRAGAPGRCPPRVVRGAN